MLHSCICISDIMLNQCFYVYHETVIFGQSCYFEASLVTFSLFDSENIKKT